MRRDGSMQTRLTQNMVYDERPDWSPDGEHILFTRREGGRAALWITDPRGQDAKRISPEGYSMRRAHWSPDGRFIVTQYRPTSDR